jgi:hypothetical protein
MNLKRIAALVAIIAAVWWAAPAPALAQCAMCKSAIANSENPAALARTIDTAVLVLFIPTMAIIGAIAGLVLKYRHYQGGELCRRAPDPATQEPPRVAGKEREDHLQLSGGEARGESSIRVT